MITIRILEAPAKNRLLVSWRQSGLCNYTEQLWALRDASEAARCAMTGRPVSRGDKVYRPMGKPVNHGTCIRADAVQLPPN